MRIDDLQKIKKQLLDALPNYKSFCILTHKNPDGDGLCAALALQEILLDFAIKADVVIEDEIPDNYEFLNGSERVKVFNDTMLYKFVIILDCHEVDRLGKCAPLLHTAKEVFVFDHHVQQQLIENSKTYINAKAVSVGAILFDMFEEEIANLPADSANYVAKALYTTVINDTDNFINMNTDAATFLFCSKLMKFDIVPGQITEQFLLCRPVNEMQFIGEALSKMATYDEDNILFIVASLDMLERHDLIDKEVSKLTRWVKGTKNVKIVASFLEINSNRYRISLRSNYINVNKIATKYGGGGHKKASGCEIKGSLEKVQQGLLEDIRNQLHSI
ncbi:MAG: DHH family phosphoesterase [Candidatus Cloacimonetes bacterium]|nr:DHH family phosphoesterase [Candidatus Cloacimonadota bacterium]MCF7813499.1 DHH family phosphoesterase [Candidatus Cloacimonadota bacterium]MCF7868578.1 DHH family phosphoesterase [Candidatus Cloacimonadota bacterium]MCF7883365.1 DHH family phosphoesterase [Candidatus Cloacimonadota bacterium]